MMLPNSYLVEESRTVFKGYSPKVAGARNSFSYCGYLQCTKTEEAGMPKFAVCGSCRHARYCSREHQVADWKAHKETCAKLQKKDKDTVIKNQLLEDFVKLHYAALVQIINYWYHRELEAVATENITDPAGYMSRMSARIHLTHCTSHGTNPARAFHLKNITFGMLKRSTDFTTRYKEALTVNRQNDPDFKHYMLCYFHIGDDEISDYTVSNWAPICSEDVQLGKRSQVWLEAMQYVLANGVVLRSIPEDSGLWTPGLLIQRGSRWVWKRRSMEQLARDGIIIISPDYWGQVKGPSAIMDPETGSPWVAPREFWEYKCYSAAQYQSTGTRLNLKVL